MVSKQERNIGLHAFASVKGGVGKSSLTVACAKLLASMGRKPLVIDCDMMGTSLADGLQLLAPKMRLSADGTLDWSKRPTREFHTREETWELRRARRYAPLTAKDEIASIPPPFLNDMLRHIHYALEEHRDIDPPHFHSALWRHPEDDGVAYLPSSPCKNDLAESRYWLEVPVTPNKFRWMHRLTWVLYFILYRRRDVTDIVVDLPPGVLTFTHELLVLVSMFDLKKAPVEGYPLWSDIETVFHVNPFLVTSADRNDLLPGLEYWGEAKVHVPSLRVLINRATEAKSDILDRVIEALGQGVPAWYFDEVTYTIDELPLSLGRVFRQGQLSLTPDVRALAEVLRLTGGAT